jgi:hypothetical protein
LWNGSGIEMNSPDNRLDVILHRPDPAVGDDGFSEGVMHALPARKFAGAKAGRWTLGGAAVAGGLLAVLLGAPLENAFTSLFLDGGFLTSVLAVLFVGAVGISAAWAFLSE